MLATKLKLVLIITLVYPIIFTGNSSARTNEKQIIIYNATILTMDSEHPKTSAIVIDPPYIKYLGDDASALKLAQKNSIKINMHKKTVLPGFIESHGHMLLMGRHNNKINLTSTKSEMEVVTQIKNIVTTTSSDKWIFGYGWNQNSWDNNDFPTNHNLSAVTPNNPVALHRIDYHAAWYNKKALEIANITKNTPDPEGGKIIRDANGNPTGVLIDKAMALVTPFIPIPTYAEDKITLEKAINSLLPLGITSFHDAAVDTRLLKLYKELLSENKLPIRIYAMLYSLDSSLVEQYLQSGPEINLGDNFLTIRSIKLFVDGALGSSGAAMLEPYHDDPNNKGLLILSQQQIEDTCYKAIKSGFQVASHAIGDRSNRIVLNAYKTTLPDNSRRFRIEHAQLIHPDDINKFNNLGVIASVQPTHCSSDMPWMPNRLGTHRTNTEAFIFKTLLQRKVRLAFGSDTPIENPNPLKGIHASIHDLTPHERINLQQALTAYTTDAAYAEFNEQTKGKLKIGYLADIVCLDRDLLNKNTSLLHTKVNLTIVAGKILYKQV